MSRVLPRTLPTLIVACLMTILTTTPIRASNDDWVVMPSGTTGTLRSVFGFSTDDVFAVGYFLGDGLILHFDGVSWSLMPDPGGYAFYDVWGSAPDDVWVVGGFGLIRHYDGSEWTESVLPVASNFIGIHGLAQDNVMAVASDGSIIHFDGTTWEGIPTSSPLELFSVWGRAADDWWAVGAQWTIHHFDGKSWNCVFEEGDLLWGIWGLPRTTSGPQVGRAGFTTTTATIG